jgi:hypothetical protein
MTTINDTSGSGKNFKQIETNNWLSASLPAILGIAGMAAVLLFAISCAKKSDNAENTKISPPASAVANGNAPVTAVALPEVPKKVKKHRPIPTTATYVNGDYGISFSFPRKYSLQPADKQASAFPVRPGFLKPGGVQVASVDMPDDSYPDTDFSSALLNVSLNPDMTAEECGQFIQNSKDPEAAKPTTVKLGNNEFTELEQMAGEETRQSDLKYFHLFKNGACYEFALDVDTSRKAGEDLAQVDRGKVFQQLEKILTTARIKDVEMQGVENAQKPAGPTETPAPSSAQVVAPLQK